MIRRGYVDTPTGGQLHYRAAGARGGTPLVLIHQSPSSSAMWDPILPKLATRGYFAVGPDLIGHGGSVAPHRPPSLSDYASGVWQVVDALGIPRLSLLGHHSGASIGLLMATQQPARVSALALWGVPLMTAERQVRLGGEGPPDWAHAETWLGDRWLRRRTASGSGWTPDILRRAMLELLQAGPNSHWLHNAVAETPIEACLEGLEQPLLTLCGELDTLHAESEQAARLAPHGRFVAMPGASLDVADQAGAELVAIVDGFLHECGADSSR